MQWTKYKPIHVLWSIRKGWPLFLTLLQGAFCGKDTQWCDEEFCSWWTRAFSLWRLEKVITQNYLCLNCPNATLGDLRSPGTIRLMKEDKHGESFDSEHAYLLIVYGGLNDEHRYVPVFFRIIRSGSRCFLDSETIHDEIVCNALNSGRRWLWVVVED